MLLRAFVLLWILWHTLHDSACFGSILQALAQFCMLWHTFTCFGTLLHAFAHLWVLLCTFAYFSVSLRTVCDTLVWVCSLSVILQCEFAHCLWYFSVSLHTVCNTLVWVCTLSMILVILLLRIVNLFCSPMSCSYSLRYKQFFSAFSTLN